MNTPVPFKPLHIEDHEHISELIYNYLMEYNIVDSKILLSLTDCNHLLESVPELRKALMKCDLTPSSIFVFCISPSTTGKRELDLHVDSDKNITVLWPVLNCKNTTTEFFDVPSDKLKLISLDQDGIKTYYRPDPGDYKSMGVLHLDHPFIIDTGVAHRVVVPEDNPLPRLSIGIRFKKQPREYLYGGNT
jgi:hypothetical protein